MCFDSMECVARDREVTYRTSLKEAKELILLYGFIFRDEQTWLAGPWRRLYISAGSLQNHITFTRNIL